MARWCDRHSTFLLILLMLIVSGYGMYEAAILEPFDHGLFLKAGRVLLSSDFFDAFETPAVQLGPLALLIYAVGDIVTTTRAGDEILLAALSFTGVALLTLAAMRVLRSDRKGSSMPEVIVVLALLGLGTFTTLFQNGHPEEAIIPLLWFFAGDRVRRDRPVAAGFLLGVAALLKPLGLLGVAVVILAPSVRSGWQTTATAVVATLGGYLPFVLLGEFEMLGLVWRVVPETLLGLVMTGAAFPWTMRVLQAAIVVAIAAGLGLKWRESPEVVWLVPLLVTAGRALTDPQAYEYYWAGTEVLVCVGAASIWRRGTSLLRLLTAGAAYVSAVMAALPFPVGLLGRVGFVGYLATVCLRGPRPAR